MSPQRRHLLWYGFCCKQLSSMQRQYQQSWKHTHLSLVSYSTHKSNNCLIRKIYFQERSKELSIQSDPAGRVRDSEKSLLMSRWVSPPAPAVEAATNAPRVEPCLVTRAQACPIGFALHSSAFITTERHEQLSFYREGEPKGCISRMFNPYLSQPSRDLKGTPISSKIL